MDNPRSWGRNSLLLMFLTVIGCSKGSVGGSALNLDSTSVQFSGFQLTVNISDQTASGVTSDSGELKYSLKGCESRTSDETTMPFVLSKQIKPIRLKAYSSLKDCSIHIESLNFAGNTFLPAQQAISSYVGSKTGIGLYMSSAEPESSWALIPSKKFSVDPETNLISINLKLVKQTNVQVGVSGEMPPLLVLSEDSPLFFEGVDPESGKGLFRIRFRCLAPTDTASISSSGISENGCQVEGMASHRLADYSVLLARRQSEGIAILPDEAEAMFAAGESRIRKFSTPVNMDQPFVEITSLSGEDKMNETSKLWLLVRYVNPATGGKSYSAWSIDAEKL